VKWNGHYRRSHCANLPLPNAGFGNSAQYQTPPEEVIKHRYFDKQKDFLSNSPFVFLSEKQRWVKWLVGFVYVFIDGPDAKTEERMTSASLVCNGGNQREIQ
jgi:hypothetical protein